MTYKTATAASASGVAFRESVREFSHFVESERQVNPAVRAVVGAMFSLAGIAIGAGLLYILLGLAR